jgi:hypothetical protein
VLELPLDTVPDGDSPLPLCEDDVAELPEVDVDVEPELDVDVLDVVVALAPVDDEDPAFVCSASNPSAATAARPPTATVEVMRRRMARARSRSAAV